jgi:hypothetical protein
MPPVVKAFDLGNALAPPGGISFLGWRCLFIMIQLSVLGRERKSKIRLRKVAPGADGLALCGRLRPLPRFGG